MNPKSEYHIIIFALLLSICTGCGSSVDGRIVRTVDEFQEAVKAAKPGSRIIMADGVWNNAELVFEGLGEEDRPITLSVETKGKVTLQGQSNIRLAGRHLVVEGLVFKKGYTPTGEVVSFKKDKDKLCNNCRVTECVIDNYNPPERHDSDYWVGIYGKNNRFDHNYLVGKKNRGVTLAVRLTTKESQENHHRIDHNFFGYRQLLGSNGGETLRVGTSHHSLTNSNTIVEDNYFENCGGELEIISSKSCQNTYRNNTFYECKGTLTMRHGNETLVTDNYFFGNGVANTGGIRIINETQTVINNYCEGLTGTRFRSGFTIMNGVPNSPPNRYFQVIDSKASNNVIVDCAHVQLCAGSDSERSAVPKDTEMKNNIIYNTKKNDVFTVYDDISGIDFDKNIISPNISFPQFSGKLFSDGFSKREIEFERVDGVLRPVGIEGVGPITKKERPSAENAGVDWYPIRDHQVRFDIGNEISVPPGENTLTTAVASSSEGDILILEAGARYHQSKSINIPHTLTVKSKGAKPLLTFERSSLFNIENGGALALEGVHISGARCDDYAGNSVVRTSRYSMINNYKFMVRDCAFTDLDVNHSFNVLRVYKNTFADSILMHDCVFDNISGHVLNMNKEIDDIGIYNVENVDIANCTFKDVGGAAIHLRRGGRDESTFGPIVDLVESTFENVGHDKRNKETAAIKLHGVQLANLSELKFIDSKVLSLHLSVGEPEINISNTNFDNSEGITSNDDAYRISEITYQKSESE